jgi:hypothetical protein
MDAEQFDTLARSLTDSRSRRRALAAVLGGALGAAGLAESDARNKKKCPPCKKRQKGKCRGNQPDGTLCKGGRCQGGRCCVPTTCADRGKDCGNLADGCGSILNCGDTCPPPQTCGGGGTPNLCGCVPTNGACDLNTPAACCDQACCLNGIAGAVCAPGVPSCCCPP